MSLLWGGGGGGAAPSQAAPVASPHGVVCREEPAGGPTGTRGTVVGSEADPQGGPRPPGGPRLVGGEAVRCEGQEAHTLAGQRGRTSESGQSSAREQGLFSRGQGRQAGGRGCCVLGGPPAAGSWGPPPPRGRVLRTRTRYRLSSRGVPHPGHRVLTEKRNWWRGRRALGLPELCQADQPGGDTQASPAHPEAAAWDGETSSPPPFSPGRAFSLAWRTGRGGVPAVPRREGSAARGFPEPFLLRSRKTPGFRQSLWGR